MSEKLTLRNYDKPTSLVIVGSTNGDDEFAITDDYSSYDITLGGVEEFRYCDCDGFVSIMSIGGFKAFVEANGYGDTFIDKIVDVSRALDHYVLPNFTGEINLKVKTDKGFADMDKYSSGYINYDMPIFVNGEELTEDDIDVIIDLPRTTNIIKITKDSWEQFD